MGITKGSLYWRVRCSRCFYSRTLVAADYKVGGFVRKEEFKLKIEAIDIEQSKQAPNTTYLIILRVLILKKIKQPCYEYRKKYNFCNLEVTKSIQFRF